MRYTGRYLAIAILAVAATSAQDELRDSVLRFEKPWDRYVRALFGCEATGEVNHETCKPHRSHIDRKHFEQAREAAKVLFDLKD